MTDRQPTDAPRHDEGAQDLDRDAKIDELLLAGLEHYFAERHQEAINIWERVLFLDRGHARARAYIERARGALAERQRRAEELVEEGVAALNRGDGSAARELLATAVAQGDPHDMARPYLDRLDRLSSTGGHRDTGTSRLPGQPVSVPSATRRLLTSAARPVRALPILAAAMVVVALMFYAASRDLLRPLVEWNLVRPVSSGSAVAMPDPLPLPRPAEMALARARSLAANGNLKPALAALDAVSSADPLAFEAVRLKASIQKTLLESLDDAQTRAGGRSGEPRQ
jgi:tetratricopeptide (TPR) repeat protein